jgi:hypothetical protein
MEVGSRNAHLDGAMRQNTGNVRPARQDRRVKPDGAVKQGPKRPRRCTPPNPGGHPSCGNRCPLNPPNRRIRTRTYGGVGGEEPRGSPLSRSISVSRLLPTNSSIVALQTTISILVSKVSGWAASIFPVLGWISVVMKEEATGATVVNLLHRPICKARSNDDNLRSL